MVLQVVMGHACHQPESPVQLPCSSHLHHLPMAPLQAHMLTHLFPRAMLALRGACRALKLLIDTTPGQVLEPAASKLLPVGLLQHAPSIEAVQTLLRRQGMILTELWSGGGGSLLRRFPAHPEQQALAVQWSPCWPCKYIAILKSYLRKSRRDDRLWQGDGCRQPVLLLDAASWQPIGGWEVPWLEDLQTHHSGWSPGSHVYACLRSGEDLERLDVVDVAAMPSPRSVTFIIDNIEWLAGLSPARETILCVERDTPAHYEIWEYC